VARKQTAKSAPEVTSERYDALRDRLLKQKQEILDMYNQDLKAGQESADDGTDDIVDRANAAYNRELMFSLSDSERTLLLQIEDALNRIHAHTYGRCASCGQAIALPRLEAVPWARFCINCQELAEKGMLNEAELA
jgi:DnaK suppressor protein